MKLASSERRKRGEMLGLCHGATVDTECANSAFDGVDPNGSDNLNLIMMPNIIPNVCLGSKPPRFNDGAFTIRANAP